MSSKAAAYPAEAAPFSDQRTAPNAERHRRYRRVIASAAATVGLVCVAATHSFGGSISSTWLDKLMPSWKHGATSPPATHHPYGIFPRAGDPLQFLPCTGATLPPSIDDEDPAASWARFYEPDPSRWSWGVNVSTDKEDDYTGRGLYLCGYLDVPRDWTNSSDSRIIRLALTKYQVAGPGSPSSPAKSIRTIVIEPGGPGGSGTTMAWHSAEAISTRLSGGAFDVLGWDPRGVNATLPSASCFPYNADRDRWWQMAHRYREVTAADPPSQIAVADAFFESMFAGCQQTLGDLGRFLGTGLVARDLDAIRAALGEHELTAYLVSYGTGIGQTYANMFPEHTGRIILDGTQYTPIEWSQGGFAWGSLDNVTHAYHDGFLGECIDAGPNHCALAQPLPGSNGKDKHLPTLAELEARLAALFASVAARPVVAYTAASGPSILTYSALVAAVYSTLYQPRTWPSMAQMLFELEQGNATLIASLTEGFIWQYDPTEPLVLPPSTGEGGYIPPPGTACPVLPVIPPLGPAKTDEVMPLVVCADSFDAPQPTTGLVWWDELWANMTAKSWIAGNSRFYNVLPCRHFAKHWPEPAGVFRGPLNASLAHPVLLVAETYDPATPLANGRLLLAEMGHSNARMVVHNGYGHSSSADVSDCTDSVLRSYILEGIIPDESETQCFANGKPYRYDMPASESTLKTTATSKPAMSHEEVVAVWRDHMQDMMMFNPSLARRRL